MMMLMGVLLRAEDDTMVMIMMTVSLYDDESSTEVRLMQMTRMTVVSQ